jgi:membrane associated rhomboid family serine protease
MKLEIRKNLFNVLAFVGFVWLIYLINLPLRLGSWTLLQYGLQPRTVPGLVGVFTMPFLHEGIDHLLGNTVPLAVLLFMLAVTRVNARRVVIWLTLLSGSLIWLLGFSSPVVGASALIYALTIYLITAGLLERKVGSVVAAVLVGVLYGTLFWGLLPTAGKSIAWDAHLLGAIAGGLFAYLTLREKNPEGSKTQSVKIEASIRECAAAETHPKEK